jgi:hypothetical protein
MSFTNLPQFDRAIATALNKKVASGASNMTPLKLMGEITFTYKQVYIKLQNRSILYKWF